jgi:(p)ppGpp synthase/HD superfamily hydrolase|tara:strand:+ start:854 stop:1369 length:516 start_codon:yes stop_codon:yes gene_type:complete
MTQAEKAKVYATHKHSGQIHGTRPFTTHLAEVVGVLHEFGYLDDNLTAAAWLHDVVEDTPVVIEEIYSEFGDRIGDLVDALTDGEGKTRMEKKQKPYATIPNVSGAVIVKLADRIANVRHTIADENPGAERYYETYKREHSGFCNALGKTGEGAAMWHILDSLLTGGMRGV